MKTEIDILMSLYSFLTADMWYAFKNEFKSEEDMIKYLKIHFNKTCEEFEKTLHKIQKRSKR